MKFSHLTPKTAIPRVLKNGIRTGNGRRGRGVYAVPLLFLPQVAFVDDGDKGIELPAEPRSSMTLWKWLAGRGRWHRHFAAIVFRTTPQNWPATLYVLVRAQVAIDWLAEIEPSQATVTDENLKYIHHAQPSNWLVDFEVLIHDPSCLGKIMHAIRVGDLPTSPRYDEKIEIVFPQPIAPNLIEEVIPLYRTNKQFKRRALQQFEMDLED